MNRKQQLIQRQQELLNTAKAAARELNAEEQAEFDNIQRELDAIVAGEVQTPGEEGERSVPRVDPGKEKAAMEVERQRCAEITDLCREFDVSKDDEQKYIRGGVSTADVRKAILDGMKAHNAPISARGSAEVIGDEQDKFRRAAGDALLMRAGIPMEKPAEGARDLMHMSLRDLAIDCLTREGETGASRRSSDELFNMVCRQFFNPTAAFPAILDNAINKAYVEGHNKAAVTFDQWTRKGTEGGELKHDVFEDKKRPTRKLKTYGRQFTLTRQAFINDDIELVTSLPARYAAAARKTINKQCYQILVNNPAVYDGTVLFSKNHGNLVTTGTGITQASMQAMIMALQTQTNEFGEAIIIRPAVLIVPSGMAFDTYTLFNSPTINTEGNTQAVNPLYRYANQIQVIEDPTINVLCGGFGNVMPWWLAGNKDDTDFMEVDYLNGKEIPTIRRMETPGTLGFVWDIYLDWGISVMDYRGGREARASIM